MEYKFLQQFFSKMSQFSQSEEASSIKYGHRKCGTLQHLRMETAIKIEISSAGHYRDNLS